MDYKEQLKDPRWIRLRKEIKERDNHRCLLCGSLGCKLNVHHLHYRPSAQAWEYNYTVLATLCEDCHKWVHESDERFVVRRSRISERYYLCHDNSGRQDIQAGKVMTSDEMDLIVVCSDIPLSRYQILQNPDGSRVNPSMYPILDEVETQISVRKDGSDLAFNEYILPIEEVGLTPATEDEKKYSYRSIEALVEIKNT